MALSATGYTDLVSLGAFFDGTAGVSFVQMNGTFQLTFKAKGVGGSKSVAVSVFRNGVATYINQTIALTNNWATYTLNFNAAEDGTVVGNAGVSFATVNQDSIYLDDVSLVQTNSSPTNPTAFRDPVVAALQSLQPGVLRYWGDQLGETLDNLIADPFGRQRSGYSAWSTQQVQLTYGLYEFLQLSETVGAEPWFVVPSTFSTADACAPREATRLRLPSRSVRSTWNSETKPGTASSPAAQSTVPPLMDNAPKLSSQPCAPMALTFHQCLIWSLAGKLRRPAETRGSKRIAIITTLLRSLLT